MKPELIIFDCDGVLVDSEPIANRVFTEALNEIDLSISYGETVRLFMGLTTEACLTLVEERLGREVPARFYENYLSRLFDAFRRELGPVPGIVSALDRIEVPICVASNGDHEKMRLCRRAAA